MEDINTIIIAIRRLKRDEIKIQSIIHKKIRQKPEIKEKLLLEISQRISEARVYNKAIERCIVEIQSLQRILKKGV